MKLVKSLAVGALALACVSSSFATTVKVTGSSAFRKALYAGIINQLGGSGVCKVAYTGASSLGSANQAVFTNADGSDVVQVCMAGSVGGIYWVANGSNVSTVAPFDPAYAAKTLTAWMAPSNATTAATLSGTTIGGGSVPGTVTWEGAQPADFAMSDSLLDSTPSAGADLVATGDLGIVQFLFAKGKANPDIPAASYNAFTNMTGLGFQNLTTSGVAKLSAFTGIASDSAYSVVLVGRDSDSGTRLATTKETGLGSVDSAIQQYRAFNGSTDIGSTSSATQLITSLANAGSSVSGYSSGGHVKRVLDSDIAASASLGGKEFIVVAYIGTGDAPAAAGQKLTYNGVAQSDLATRYGQYTFWTKQQGYYTQAAAGDARGTLIGAIAADINVTYAPAAAGVPMADMLCDRGSEGSVIYLF